MLQLNVDANTLSAWKKRKKWKNVAILSDDVTEATSMFHTVHGPNLSCEQFFLTKLAENIQHVWHFSTANSC